MATWTAATTRLFAIITAPTTSNHSSTYSTSHSGNTNRHYGTTTRRLSGANSTCHSGTTIRHSGSNTTSHSGSNTTSHTGNPIRHTGARNDTTRHSGTNTACHSGITNRHSGTNTAIYTGIRNHHKYPICWPFYKRVADSRNSNNNKRAPNATLYLRRDLPSPSPSSVRF